MSVNLNSFPGTINITATTAATAQLVLGPNGGGAYQPSILVCQDGSTAIVELIVSDTTPTAASKSCATLGVNTTSPQTIAFTEMEIPVTPATHSYYAYLSTGTTANITAGGRAH